MQLLFVIHGFFFVSSMKIYLINLDRSPDRLAWFMKENAPFADRVERIQAIDGRDLSPEEIEKYRSRRGRKTILGVGDIACALSHNLAWQRFVDSKAPWAFFAEDDLLLSSDAQKFLENDTWIPGDADVVKAETFMEPTFLSRFGNQKVFGRRLARLKSQHLGTAGYFLSARTAAWLIEYTKSVFEPADQILFGADLNYFGTRRVYQIDPAVCMQRMYLDNSDDDTDLTSNRLDTNAELGEPVYLRIPKKKTKPTGWAKVRRELGRPFRPLVRRYQLYREESYQRRLRIVPFR